MISKKFILNTIKKFIFILLKTNKIENIYNYHQIEGLFETSGQPTENELILISRKFNLVINLAPISAFEKKIINEKKILESLNVNYIHIPVDFKNPSSKDFEKFVSAINANKDKKIWIHCAANMRVSAFVYKYRKEVLKMEHSKIVKDLHTLWNPNNVWSDFIGFNNN